MKGLLGIGAVEILIVGCLVCRIDDCVEFWDLRWWVEMGFWCLCNVHDDGECSSSRMLNTPFFFPKH